MAMYDYNKRNWEDEVTNAQARKRAAEEAVNGYGSFSYGRQADYDAARDAVLNRGPFKYDLNKDALYKQVAENYKNLGKIAMQDTIGQASAMTGGYGNSYAQTAGQQAYQQFMQKSNEMIPQFYQMARENYDAEGNDLRAKLGILADDRNTAYGEWRDRYGQLVSERDYAGNEYNNIYNAALEAAKLQLARSSGGGGGGKRSGSGNDGNTVQAIKTGNVEKFLTSIPTETGFNIVKAGGMRGYSGNITNPANAQQQEEYKKYKTYNDFLTAKIDNELANGTMSAGEAAWLIDYYGL